MTDAQDKEGTAQRSGRPEETRPRLARDYLASEEERDALREECADVLREFFRYLKRHSGAIEVRPIHVGDREAEAHYSLVDALCPIDDPMVRRALRRRGRSFETGRGGERWARSLILELGETLEQGLGAIKDVLAPKGAAPSGEGHPLSSTETSEQSALAPNCEGFGFAVWVGVLVEGTSDETVRKTLAVLALLTIKDFQLRFRILDDFDINVPLPFVLPRRALENDRDLRDLGLQLKSLHREYTAPVPAHTELGPKLPDAFNVLLEHIKGSREGELVPLEQGVQRPVQQTPPHSRKDERSLAQGILHQSKDLQRQAEDLERQAAEVETDAEKLERHIHELKEQARNRHARARTQEDPGLQARARVMEEDAEVMKKQAEAARARVGVLRHLARELNGKAEEMQKALYPLLHPAPEIQRMANELWKHVKEVAQKVKEGFDGIYTSVEKDHPATRLTCALLMRKSLIERHVEVVNGLEPPVATNWDVLRGPLRSWAEYLQQEVGEVSALLARSSEAFEEAEQSRQRVESLAEAVCLKLRGWIDDEGRGLDRRGWSDVRLRGASREGHKRAPGGGGIRCFTKEPESSPRRGR